ncbi:MAG: ABC transporter ATP-binding protein/permease [Alphaproteobacteria bacterium]|nr:ABC transporter ATP-binding protein/permease [Alphaproteobacteria bacterium]
MAPNNDQDDEGRAPSSPIRDRRRRLEGAQLPPPKTQLASWIEFFPKFLRLAGPYCRSEEAWQVWWRTAILIVLTICQVGIAIVLNLWNEALFNALEARELSRFFLLLGVLGVIIVANVAIVTTHLRVKRRLQIGWREWLTKRLMNEWMSGGRHYLVTHMPGDHDNPDGRIAEDIRISTESAIDLAHSLLYAGLLLFSFTSILWNLSGSPHVSLGGYSMYLPGHLVWIALVYAMIGTSIAMVLGYPLVRAANQRQTAEADFRYSLVHAREHSLPIALLRGERHERSIFLWLFRLAGAAWDRQTTALTHLFMFSSAWSVLAGIFPIIVAAPRYILGLISLGVLMQTAQAFQQMVSALSWPIDNFAGMATWRASVERVQNLHHALDHLSDRIDAPGWERIEVVPSDRPVLAFKDFQLADAEGNVVVGAFSTEIEKGERILIDGDPGASVNLFKAAAGLWPWGSGRIERPKDGRIFILLQHPYLPEGKLKSVISYPTEEFTCDDELARKALVRVGLPHLVEKLYDHQKWDQTLSSAEQQRLSFARLLIHRPDWIFIQEAIDALDPKGEEDILNLLKTEFADATVITIGHHAGAAGYYQRVLTLYRKNGYAIVEDSKDEPPGQIDERR